RKSEFSKNRYALLFKPGTYNLDVRVGYYMHVIGLGNSPEEVIITGAVRSNSTRGGNVLTNFWRAAENLTIIPSADSTNTWAVSQAAPLRRIHVKGNLKLHDNGYASGGFLADSKIDGTVISGPQQQWFSRNTDWKKWNGGVWNMMFVGVPNAPAENWPTKPFTTIPQTPLVREKPYLVFEHDQWSLKIPALKKNSTGTNWDDPKGIEMTVPMTDFYVAKASADNAQSINKALKKGKHILFTPGIYSLDESLKVTHPGTIVFGIGMPSLEPTKGNRVMEVSDVNNITVAGLLLDANVLPSITLMQIGEPGSKKSHEAKPTFLYDVFFRVGGPHEGLTSSCLVINSNDVCIDHVWLWRADHGAGVGWDKNKSANGLIVNGNNVTVYGLFNEHFQEYQTLWNGENGRVYFYQSEMPYDPPTVDSWKHGDTFGYASYKVADHVKNHHAWGVGIYNVFYNAPVVVDQAIETPELLENNITHKVIFWLNGNKESVVKSIINGKGGSVNSANRKATM
ncbi:MAG TPA: glycoside hydrolase family 16, partial [Prolixibacteraceae bacterium]